MAVNSSRCSSGCCCLRLGIRRDFDARRRHPPRAPESARRAPRSRRTGRRRRTPARAAPPRPAAPRRARRPARASRSPLASERHAGRGERRPDLRRRLADQVDSAGALGHRRGERRVVPALAAAAEDHVHAARERLEPGDRRGDVRGLRVVDVEDAVERRDLLQPVRDAGEAREPRADGVGGHPAGERHGRRRHRVEAVVGPAQPDLLERDQALRVPPQRALAGGEPGRRTGPEPDALGLPRQPAGRELLRRHGDRAGRLAGEDLELGGAVGVERPVAVEMVLGEVEQHAGVGREALGVLELERGRLADDRRRPPAARVPASVESAVPTLPTTSAARPAVRCRWPISSTVVVLPFEPVTAIISFGTSRQPISSSPTTGKPGLARRDHDRRLRRHAGALDHRAGGREQLDPERAGMDRDPGRLELRPPLVRHRPRVAAGDRRAAAAQRERHRDAGAGEPHDQVGTGWERRPREHARIVSEGVVVPGGRPLERPLRQPPSCGLPCGASEPARVRGRARRSRWGAAVPPGRRGRP